MALDWISPVAPAAVSWSTAGGVLRRIQARFAAPRLDRRLAAGEDPSIDAALACRAAQLVSDGTRRGIASGLARVLSARPEAAAFSASIPCNARAVSIARPALEQLAAALRSWESIDPRGVAITQVLLTEPGSALYRPSYNEELYEVAREALFALGARGAAHENARTSTSLC
jgi:hypothetical protein